MKWSTKELLERKRAYDELVKKRKKCQLCKKLKNPSKVLEGALDSDEIGPWTKWQGSLFPDVMVIGQDFSDEGSFIRYFGNDNKRGSTNKKLKEKLNELGYCVDYGDRGLQQRLFFTNSVLCLKDEDKGVQGPISSKYSSICGESFLKPLILILKPKVVIAMGQLALNAVSSSFELESVTLKSAVRRVEGETIFSGTRLFVVYHLNSRVKNSNQRSFQEQEEDWVRIRNYLRR